MQLYDWFIYGEMGRIVYIYKQTDERTSILGFMKSPSLWHNY